MIYNEKITIKINKKNINYFIKDFENIKSGDIISIDTIDLIKYWKKSILKIKVQCNKCNKDFNIPIKLIDDIDNILCKSCKTKHTNLEKYGVENVYQNEEIKDKIKQTNLEKYGVENISQNEEIKKRKEKTCLKNNNVKYPSQSSEIKEKIKQANLEKYGVENISQNKEIKKRKEKTCLKNYGFKCGFLSPKIKQTNLKRYGVENVFQSKEIREKILISMYQNGTGMSSRPQRYLCNLLKGELCYPVSRCQLDIAFPDEMLYIEYNGGGHYAWDLYRGKTMKEIDRLDIKRHYFLKNNGWKLIKIVSLKDKLLNDTKMIDLINKCKNYLLNNDCNWININIDTMIIECSRFTKTIEEVTNEL